MSVMSDTPIVVPSPTAVTPHSIYGFLANDYIRQPREAETWLLKPLIPAGGAALLYAEAKMGKSFLALQLAAALNGSFTDFMSFPVATAGQVLYIQLDTPRSLWADRLATLIGADYPVGGVVCVDRESLDCWPFDIMNHVHFRKVRAEVDSLKPIAVIIDTIREAHSQDENDSTAMRNVMAALVAATQPAALIIISHARKPSVGPDGSQSHDLMADNRGSSYIVGRMDVILRLGRKGLYYSGRATEGGQIKMKRLTNGLWEPDTDLFKGQLAVALADPRFTTLRERARSLAELSGKSEDACAMALSRASHQTPLPAAQAQP